MSDDAWKNFAAALADDAESLATLHDRELDATTVTALKTVDFPSSLGLLPDAAAAQDAWALMAAAVAELPAAPDAAALDELAADYAAIYLTGAHGASPCESVWLDDDQLICQAPMFALREIYAQAGLATADWRRRPDDHLVLQLLYVAGALDKGAGDADWRALATMMDEHLLRWVPQFAVRVASRAAQPFYAGLASLTADWCEGLRNLIAEHLGEPRPTADELAARSPRPKAEPAPLAYLPGAGPTW